MESSSLWIVMECVCRILGISTAAVLLGVGTETLLQGEFESLAVYLLVSAGGVIVFEVSYFIDILLGPCFLCPSGSQAFILWKKTARFGGFQKFLYYTLMSVVCFLHPVLVWHAVIPGIMLLITALAYFILSKKKKAELPKDPATPSEHYSDPSATALSLTEAGSTEQTYTFSAGKTKKTPLAYFQSLLKRQPKDNIQEKLNQGTVDARSEVPASKGKKKQVHFEEHAVKIIPDEPEMVECQEMDEEETTSDKAPIIRA